MHVIFETDMTFDVDDVGALAVLHALANQSKVEILAVMYNEVHLDAIPAISAINSWYGRPDIPIGTFNGKLSRPDASKYLAKLSTFPHSVSYTADSVDLYVKILKSQPDQSIKVVSVGFLNNLAKILQSNKELVKNKVSQLIVMGGRNNDRFNFVRHDLLQTTKYVLKNWPTPITLTDAGYDIRTGIKLRNTPPENPVREAYFQWFDEDFRGRASWDQVAVLYATEGTGSLFSRVTQGEIKFSDGDSLPLLADKITIAEPKLDSNQFADIIDRLMVQAPLN